MQLVVRVIGEAVSCSRISTVTSNSMQMVTKSSSGRCIFCRRTISTFPLLNMRASVLTGRSNSAICETRLMSVVL